MPIARRPLLAPAAACAAYSAALVALALAPAVPVSVPDAAAHAGAYGLHALFLVWLGSRSLSPLGAPVAACVGATAFGGFTELLQSLAPPRTAELRDLLADLTGAASVLVGVMLARRTLAAARKIAGIAGTADDPSADGGETPGRETMRTQAERRDDEAAAGATCIHCREPIRTGAARCPSCQAWQSRWAADSQNPRLELALLVAGAGAVALLVAWLVLHEPRGARDGPRAFAPGAVSVVEAAFVPFETGGHPALAIVGTLRNRTSVAWRDLFLHVRCLDRDGNVIDTLAARPAALIVPPGKETGFRIVEPQPLRDPGAYARCEVEVRWALRID